MSNATAPQFGDAYAAMYDVLYTSKDYGRECDLLETAFGVAHHEVRSVLDLGCGTGNHAIPLAQRGYEVVGVDRSPAMLDTARRKADAADVSSVGFQLGDLRTLSLGRTFDACLMMFAVLSYQTSNQDVHAALSVAANHLAPGGVLAFDTWYGPAVLDVGPSERFRILGGDSQRILRHSSGTLDVRRHLCHVRIHQLEVHGDKIVSETDETHSMRFFFPQELELYLERTGFELVEMTGFDRADGQLDSSDWIVMVTARRRAGR